MQEKCKVATKKNCYLMVNIVNKKYVYIYKDMFIYIAMYRVSIALCKTKVNTKQFVSRFRKLSNSIRDKLKQKFVRVCVKLYISG